MAYSSIIKKKCKCGCEKYPTISFDGYYYLHAPQEIKDRQGLKSKRGYQNKLNKAKANNLSNKVKSFAKGEDAFRVPQKYELDKWFDERMERCDATCENCGATNTNLKKTTYKILWKSCQGHLLPKRHFKSISTHSLNGMVLGSGFSGLCYCHDQYDSSWEKAAKMNIWPEVVRRFLIMYPLIPQEEQSFIPDQLLQEINQI